MERIRKISLMVMMLALGMSVAVLTGCSVSSTHESETNFEVSTDDGSSDEAATPIEEACSEIFDYLEGDWDDSFHVSYTGDDGSDEANTVYVQLWKDGIQSIDNTEEIKEYMVECCGSFAAILEEKGVENGHVMMQLLVGVDNEDSYTEGTSVLDVLDGEVTYDAAAEAE